MVDGAIFTQTESSKCSVIKRAMIKLIGGREAEGEREVEGDGEVEGGTQLNVSENNSSERT